MKKITVLMMMLGIAVSLPANAQFGKLLGKGKSAGKKNISYTRAKKEKKPAVESIQKALKINPAFTEAQTLLNHLQQSAG